jgi:hypothetical protein
LAAAAALEPYPQVLIIAFLVKQELVFHFLADKTKSLVVAGDASI